MLKGVGIFQGNEMFEKSISLGDPMAASLGKTGEEQNTTKLRTNGARGRIDNCYRVKRKSRQFGGKGRPKIGNNYLGMTRDKPHYAV